MKFPKLLLSVLIIATLSNCDNDTDNPIPSIPDIELRTMAGGNTTIFESGFFSFDNPAPNLSAENLEMHLDGDAQFEAAFVTAPAEINPGLGVQFNNTSCIACHPKDGRAGFPSDINSFSGFFLRVSIPGENENGGPNPVPGFGGQLQNHAIYGKQPEVQFNVTYENIPISFKDGSEVILKKPHYTLYDSYIPLPANAMLSPRIGPPVYGLGLLETIPAEDLLVLQDIDDIDNDEISGKANMVWDPISETKKIGRFGWKAGAPSILVQSAGAYHGDMGITSPLFPIEADYGQTNGDNSLNNEPEISQEILDQVTLYCQTLAVPAARSLDDESVVRGYELFLDAKCNSCHVEKHTTGTNSSIPAISNQIIYPFTDMLLHDMGDNLADNRPEFLADGNEWQTRPLWGIGLTNKVNGHTDFLHDGRAKNIEEAILWHGGEAKKSQEFYRNLSKKDREDFINFLKSI